MRGKQCFRCTIYQRVNGSPPRMRGKPAKQCSYKLLYRITPADAGKTRSKKARRLSAKDHPRGCGENASRSAAAQSRAGSPPRMRGKLSNSTKTLLTNRITPADAGKTKPHCRACRQRQDHPRGCGENTKLNEFSRDTPGSPPRMRGKQDYFCKRFKSLRITPADAGKTLHFHIRACVF